MQTIRKSYPFQLKSASDPEGTFEGYASVFGVVDAHDEVVDRGAFAKTIREGIQRVKLYYSHGWIMGEPPIGVPLEIKEDDHGLFIRGRILPTTLGSDVLTLMRGGAVDEMSIGARVIKTAVGEDKRLHFKELSLFDISPTPRAANQSARITEVKSERLIYALRDLTPNDINPDALKAAIESLKALLPTEPDDSTPVDDAAASVKADEPVLDHSALIEVLRDFASLSAEIRSLI
jgi:HK97 family phage prohead protease